MSAELKKADDELREILKEMADLGMAADEVAGRISELNDDYGKEVVNRLNTVAFSFVDLATYMATMRSAINKSAETDSATKG